MSNINQEWNQELNSFLSNPTINSKNQMRTQETNHSSKKSGRKNLLSVENKLDVVEKLIKFLSNEK